MPYPGKQRFFPVLPVVLMIGMGLSSCATYYQKNYKFHDSFESADLEAANKYLEKNEKKASEGKDRLLYFLDRGVVLQILGEYEKSNEYLEQAYFYVEDYKKNYSYEMLSLISNPMIRPYSAEDHEKVLIHYYKAVNYLFLNQPDKALVEARRINNKLNELNFKYEGRVNRYKDDAFAHIIMGLAYELDNDVNNAFIAYRNAYETYKSIYSSEFGVAAPEQLKMDLLRTAYLNGFRSDLEFYEKEFGLEYTHVPKSGGELVFLWHNGLGPVKAEWSINFTIVDEGTGIVTFVNEEYGLSFPFPVSRDDDGKTSFGDLKVVRVAFPKYVSRPVHYGNASLLVDSARSYPVEAVENVDDIAISVLQDRMFREMSSALLRLATKQAAEYATRQENQDLGAMVSLINALTEKADTRNWQTLPHTIGYSRVSMEPGNHRVELITETEEGKDTQEFNFEIKEGETIFQLFHSL